MRLTTGFGSVFTLLAVAVLLAACSGGPPPESGDRADREAPAAERPARTLPIPGADLPSAHPPLNEAGRMVEAGPLEWDVPDGWIQEQPRSSMRFAQYRVEGAGGPGECVVYYFGPGQGGDARSNAIRWANQFRQPDGTSSVEVMEYGPIADARLTSQLVEVTGVYDGGMTMTDAPAAEQANYMLLGGIADGPDAPWFFKFTGPEATLREQRDAFVEMMRSVRVRG